MKNTSAYFIITLLIFLLIKTSLVAQNLNISDYLVLNSGDTLYGEVKHIDQGGVSPEFYKKIRLINNKRKQKKYKRDDISAFKENNTIYEGFWLNRSSQKIIVLNPRYNIDSQNGERYFLRLISKGKLSHYELEWLEQGDSAVSRINLFKKGKDPYFIRATQGIFGLKRKALVDYFKDCPDLAEQIERKRLNDVRQVVNYYNRNCS